jgi:hypothetical protein
MKAVLRKSTKVAAPAVLMGFISLIVPCAAQAQNLYGHDNISHQLVTINSSTAAVSPIGGSGLGSTVRIVSLAYHPTNGLFGVGFDTTDALYHFYGFNTVTGAATSISSLGVAASSADGLEYVGGSLNSLILFKSTGNNFYGDALNTINPITGVLTSTGVSTGPSTDNDFGVFDSSRNKFYTMDDNHGSIREINLSTGFANSYGSLDGHFGDGAYSSSADKIFHTGDSGANFYQINPSSLTSPTLVGSFGAGKEIFGIASGPSAAPEPGTLVLISIGSMGFAVRLRRQKA